MSEFRRASSKRVVKTIPVSKSSQSENAVGAATNAYPWHWAGVVLVGMLVVAILRRPPAFFNAQFWAEDGSVFFTQAAALKWQALTLPHAGYHHLIQRLWAGVLMEVPLRWMPTAFVVATALGWSAVVLFLFSPRVRVRWPILMAVVLVLLPSSNELWFNLTNLQWTTALLIPLWLVADDPRTKGGLAAQWVASFLVGMTGVFSIAAAPWFVVKAVIRRSWKSGGMAALWLLTAWLQFTTARNEGAAPAGALAVGESLAIVGKRVVGTLMMPSDWPANWLVHGGMGLGVAGLTWMGWRTWKTQESRPYLLWAGFVGLVVLATLWRFQSNLADLRPPANGERYFFVPKVIIFWGLIQMAAGATKDRWVAVAALVVGLTVAGLNFRLPPLIDNDWPMWVQRIEEGERGWVPITPEGFRFMPPDLKP